VILPGLLLISAAVGGGRAWLTHGQVSTDDAQLEGHVGSVSPRVAGQVVRVHVKDNQHVKAGDLLVELDPRDLSVRVAAARADLAAARAQSRAAETQLALTNIEVDSNLTVARGGVVQAAASGGTTQAAIEQAHADIAAAETQRALAKTELTRTERLFDTGALSQSQLDSRKAALEQAEAMLAQTKARLASAQSNVGNAEGGMQSARGRLIAAQSGPQRVAAAVAQVELARARADQAQAALEQAELSLSYTNIRAEVAGVISRRNVEAGQLVSPERPLLAIVTLDDVWVVANYKEDQLAHIKPGQRAEIAVDAFPDRTLRGTVDSLAGGTGARFSLFPPDNASGNFTKVVQRVPVLIRLEAHPGLELRPGLSAVAKVFTE
jgi:membrane fusion protein (multidrug efflux system)